MAGVEYNTRSGFEKGALTPVYWLVCKLEQLYLAVTRRGATFDVNGEAVAYERAMYNRTWANERCVELAIAEHELARTDGKVLELGHVLGHYREHDHAVVDKYEAAPGVRNVDVLDIPAGETYDFIFTLSTMEHVGWDETPREPEKFLVAYDKLYDLLAPGGHLLVTLPIGWNDWLDDALGESRIANDGIDWFARTGKYLSWEQSDREAVLAKKYGDPYGNANGLAVLRRRRPAA